MLTMKHYNPPGTAPSFVEVEAPFGIRIGRNVYIGSDVKIGSGCTIQDHAVIQSDAVIERGCVVGAHSVVAQGARMPVNSVTFAGEHFPATPPRTQTLFLVQKRNPNTREEKVMAYSFSQGAAERECDRLARNAYADYLKRRQERFDEGRVVAEKSRLEDLRKNYSVRELAEIHECK